MSAFFLHFLVLARFAVIGEGGGVAEIHVFNRVGIPESVYQNAVKQAQEIFDRAGVPTYWRLCPNPRLVPKEQACPVVPSAFLLGIVQEDKMLMSQRDLFTIGYTLRTAGRNNAAVIWPRVRSYAGLLSINPELLLGFAMAHEIGHLLSPIGYHSVGIMEPAWSREDALDMARGRLGFCSNDVKIMREQALRIAKANGSNPHAHSPAAP